MKAKNQIWLEIYNEFLHKLTGSNIINKKSLNQIKTKARSFEKEFKEVKARISRTGEGGAQSIKEKMEGVYDILDQYLSQRDSIDPSKMKILSSGSESTGYAIESSFFLTDESDLETPLAQKDTQKTNPRKKKEN